MDHGFAAEELGDMGRRRARLDARAHLVCVSARIVKLDAHLAARLVHRPGELRQPRQELVALDQRHEERPRRLAGGHSPDDGQPPAAAGGGPLRLAAVAIAGALLAWQHRLITADDLTAVNAAFFSANGTLALMMGVFFFVARIVES